MPHSVQRAHASDPVRLPDKIGYQRVKPSPTSDFTYGEAIWEVIVKSHGSVKSAAFTMGNTDPSLLRRQILDGTLPLKKLFEADPKALATFGEFLQQHFGDAKKTRQEIAREKLPELFAAILDAIDPQESK